jgi:sarcosine oxidase
VSAARLPRHTGSVSVGRCGSAGGVKSDKEIVKYDVVVIGLGVTGAASAWQLGERGARVLGLDRFSPPHGLGSSHGGTRVTREAYFEQPAFVPLVRRARALWRALEQATGRTLFRATGVLSLGAAGGRIARGALASARAHGVAIELLEAAAVRRRFEGLAPDADMIGVYEPGAGLLFPESCVTALHEAARAAGAALVHDEGVLGLEPGADEVVVRTTSGRYAADRVVVAAGSWLPALLPDLRLPLVVERQVTTWFEAPPYLAAARSPVTLWEVPDGTVLYTCPDVGEGFKAALHHGGPAVDPETVDRSIHAADVAAIRQRVAHYLPGADGPPLRSSVCLYTNTPDDAFILDVHPGDERIVIASACSGHGFKFGPAVGEIVTDLIQQRPSTHDRTPFGFGRFGARACDAGACG